MTPQQKISCLELVISMIKTGGPAPCKDYASALRMFRPGLTDDECSLIADVIRAVLCYK